MEDSFTACEVVLLSPSHPKKGNKPILIKPLDPTNQVMGKNKQDNRTC